MEDKVGKQEKHPALHSVAFVYLIIYAFRFQQEDIWQLHSNREQFWNIEKKVCVMQLICSPEHKTDI